MEGSFISFRMTKTNFKKIMEVKPNTILVVEDEPSLNKAISLKLKKKGINVISVGSAEEAWNLLEKKESQVDLIWLDLLLPGMNGMEFLRLIRQKPEFKDYRVVIVSVSGGVDTKEEARRLGVVDYLVKSEHKLEDLTDQIIKDIKN